MKVATVVGARPQFIKAAPVSCELERSGLQECLIHTGQHYDYRMSKIFFDELGIPEPNYSLGVGSGSHGAQTGEMMKRIEPVLEREKPDVVLVYGDTNSTLAGALVAAKLNLPVVHVEAGLRSYDRSMPEELNRIVTDHVSSLCLAPTAVAAENLRLEGVTKNVEIVGDVMVDLALKTARELPRRPAILDDLSLEPGEFVLATIHRPANTDDPEVLRRIMTALDSIGSVVLPVHPRLHASLDRFLLKGSYKNIKMSEPLSYTNLIALQKFARVVVTDSGGMQKESFVLGTPCVTLRRETEWVETLEDGWNVLAGQDPHRILAAAARTRPVSPQRAYYGSGTAAAKVVASLPQFFGSARRLAV